MRLCDHRLREAHNARDHECSHRCDELLNPGRSRIDLRQYPTHVQGHGTELSESEHRKNHIRGPVHEIQYGCPIGVGVRWAGVLNKAFQGPEHPGTHQGSKSAVKKLLELAALAVAVYSS